MLSIVFVSVDCQHLSRSPIPFSVDLDTPIQLHDSSSQGCGQLPHIGQYRTALQYFGIKISNRASQAMHFCQPSYVASCSCMILCIRRRYILVLYTKGLLNPFKSALVADHMNDGFDFNSVCRRCVKNHFVTIIDPWPITAFLTHTSLFHM